MKKVKIGPTPIVIATVIFLGFLLWLFFNVLKPADSLTIAEAKEIVQDMYGGDITEVSETNEAYLFTVKTKSGLYDIYVQRKDGDILKVDQKNPEPAEAPNEQTLPEDKIKEIIHDQYGGEINRLEKKREGDRYFYYAVLNDGQSNQTIKVDAQTGSIVESSGKTSNGITEQDAAGIALQQVKGKVEDVDLKESDGLKYYLVEIESDQDQEATVQIHSITGEVLSITWDD
ncbi:PepSY domain-containing protein [Siminovitchia sp. FSL W7-1587]|uniref:PepSY domain-containing protein n=1 Tax=Siminovitchia sp. FSL W7-1587 TaxID=2954699 RepID=UPI0030D1420B